MVVSVTWSLSSGGAAISSPQDHGTVANGSVGSSLDLYISHDGTNKITGVGFYIRAYSGGGYDGVGSPADDYNELITWGNAWATAGDGGFEIAQNAASPSWAVHKTGSGTVSSPIGITTDAGVSSDDEIGSGEEAHIKVRVGVPSSESTAGKRMFDQCLAFTYTS
jgi:hypothetical protein